MRIQTTASIPVFLLAAALGCAPSGLYPHPAFSTPSAGSGEVFVAFENGPPGIWRPVQLDKQDLAILRPGEFARFRLGPGNYKIEIPSRPSWRRRQANVQRFDVNSGETLYLRIAYGHMDSIYGLCPSGDSLHCPEIGGGDKIHQFFVELIDAGEGERLVGQSVEVTAGLVRWWSTGPPTRGREPQDLAP